MVKLVNRAKMKVASGGAGTLTLGLACDGYQTFAAAGVTDQNKLRYTITDGNDWEIGIGTYTASGTTLARAPTESSNYGNAITCGSGAEIFVTMAAEDFSDNAAPAFTSTIPDTLDLTAGAVSTIDAKALDDDGFPISYSFDAHNGTTVYSPSSLPPQLSAVAIDQTTGVFSLTAVSSASGAGNVNFRVRASDGVRGATKKVVAKLSFLPTSGLKGLYDLKDTSSFDGTGTTWTDTSGNSGPDMTVNLSVGTYNSNGLGGIPQLEFTSGNATPLVQTSSSNLTNSSGKATVCAIFAKGPDSSGNSDTSYRMFGNGTAGSRALQISTSTTASMLWVGTGVNQTAVASSQSKVYVDKVDVSALTRAQFHQTLASSDNYQKYHSIVLTEAYFSNGFMWNDNSNASALGNLRALVFYDRALTSDEVLGLHAHFASDYSSSEMIQ